MLKKRIIPIQLLKNGRLVKSCQFDNDKDVGCPISSSKVYNDQYADELIFLNINEQKSITPLLSLLEEVSKICFMPLSLGGGIQNFDDAKSLFQQGADKIILNSLCYQTPKVITEIKNHFGTQAIITCIDVKKDKDNKYHLFSNNGQKKETIKLNAHIKNCIYHGAGEIMIQSIDNDGKMQGFDINLIQKVCQQTKAPIIACGGSGNYEHLKEAFLQTEISAIACGSIFNFSDSNLIRAKAFLSNYQIPFKAV